MHELETGACWVVLKWNIWATTLKACWSRRPKRTELPRVPVHGVAAGMEREASAQYGVPAETGPLPVGQNAGAVRLRLPGPGFIDRKVVRELAGLAFVEHSERDPAGSAWCG